MERLRATLQRLGWPTESLSDDEIARELYRRWFACCRDYPEPQHTISLAAANGILARMANDGNLDALCWSTEEGAAPADDLTVGEVFPFERKGGRDRSGGGPPHPDRRKSPRTPASDFIDFVLPPSSDGSSGWLVDVSAEGIAFIAETKDTPAVGARIIPTIRKRGGRTAELGSATIVRTELLTEFLSLVCAQLEEP